MRQMWVTPSEWTATPAYVWIVVFSSVDGVVVALMNDPATAPYHAGSLCETPMFQLPALIPQGSIQGRDYSEGLQAGSGLRSVSVGTGRLNDLRSKLISASHVEMRFQLLVVWDAIIT